MDHFKEYLRPDVRIVDRLPDELSEVDLGGMGSVVSRLGDFLGRPDLSSSYSSLVLCFVSLLKHMFYVIEPP